MKRKGQIWSTDAIIATTVFLIAFIAIILIINTVIFKPAKEKILIEENEHISDTLSAQSTGYSFVYNDRLDVGKMEEFADLTEGDDNYEAMKRELGLKSDFCIHFKDEEGNIIRVGDTILLGDPQAVVELDGEPYNCNGNPVS